jgi:enterochelin esterase-like enzyme
MYLDLESENIKNKLADPEKFNADFDLFFLSAGEYEHCCGLNRLLTQELRKKGINSVFYSVPGYHDWPVWRYCAREFISRLWR